MGGVGSGKGNQHQVCSICSAPGDLCKVVNDQLAKKVTHLKIAQLAGFSRQAVQRHAAKHWQPMQLQEHRTKSTFNGRTQQVWTLWNGKLEPFSVPPGMEEKIVPVKTDVIWRCEYAAEVTEEVKAAKAARFEQLRGTLCSTEAAPMGNAQTSPT
jgi:hypothetical protein